VSESVQIAPPHVPSAPGTLFIPKSSQPKTAPAGHRFSAHTNVEIFLPHGLNPEEAPPFSGYGYETPASLACRYGLVSPGSGIAPNCNPNSTTVVPTGGSKTIAVVDAYDDPSAPGDLAWFSLQFGVPLSLSDFQVVWANTASSSCNTSGVPIDETGGWELEESLGIEWAHAMAPKANIYLVEACSELDSDLQQAVLVANNLVQCGQTEINPTTLALGTCPAGSTGKGEVTMSWGAGEFVGENTSDKCATLDDSCFLATNVVYFAAAGDSPGVIWPGTSPNVVSAGGTTLRRNGSTFNFTAEAAWVDGGGGQSAIETIPSYQSSVKTIVGKWRGVPDLSFDSDPYTGVWVYDTFPIEGFTYDEWIVVGGTSVSTQALAGIVNSAGSFAASSNAELTTMYKNMATAADFTDITYGFCGFYMGFSAGTGWDFCTGIGADKGYAGK
jgi:subtilase family serine protease